MKGGFGVLAVLEGVLRGCFGTWNHGLRALQMCVEVEPLGSVFGLRFYYLPCDMLFSGWSQDFRILGFSKRVTCVLGCMAPRFWECFCCFAFCRFVDDLHGQARILDFRVL